MKRVFVKQVAVPPKFMNGKIRESAVNILKQKYGNRCVEEGYIVADSMEVIDYGVPKLFNSQLKGYIRYQLKFEADVVMPMVDEVIEVKVSDVIKVGVLGVGEEHPFLKFRFYRDKHEDKEVFNDIEVGDIISGRVVDINFRINYEDIEVEAIIQTDSKKEPAEEPTEDEDGPRLETDEDGNEILEVPLDGIPTVAESAQNDDFDEEDDEGDAEGEDEFDAEGEDEFDEDDDEDEDIDEFDDEE